MKTYFEIYAFIIYIIIYIIYIISIYIYLYYYLSSSKLKNGCTQEYYK